MVTKHSTVCDCDDIEPFAEAFEVEQPKLHDGIFWCYGCERELSLMRENGDEVFVF